MESVLLPGNGIELHAKVWRRAEPPLLVLHGIWESWRTFAAFAEGASRTVYCLDLRGHGDSARPSDGYRFADYAGDVRAVLDALPHSTVDVLGHSLGANVALFVADHPKVRRVVVADPPILLPDDWPPVRDGMRRGWELARLPLPEIEQAMARPDRDPEWTRMMASALANTADGVFAAMVHGDQGEVDWQEVLAPITVPVLALVPDPAVPGSQLAGARLDAFRRFLPHAVIRRFDGAGHHIEADRPAEFGRAVEDFTRRS